MQKSCQCNANKRQCKTLAKTKGEIHHSILDFKLTLAHVWFSQVPYGATCELSSHISDTPCHNTWLICTGCRILVLLFLYHCKMQRQIDKVQILVYNRTSTFSTISLQGFPTWSRETFGENPLLTIRIPRLKCSKCRFPTFAAQFCLLMLYDFVSQTQVFVEKSV